MSARKDWWRFWFVNTKAPAVCKGAVSLTLYAGTKSLTVGYRRKRWVE